MTMLDTILSTKRAEVAARRGARSRFDLDAAIARQTPPRGFRAALRAASGRAVIGEIKRASPSKGAIRADGTWDPPAHARALQAGGAACLSVLTDETFFRGADAFLVAAREATSLPVLRKDFTVDPWQAHEARAIGADAILLIVAALDDGALHEIEAAALDHCMDVLVEVRDEGELERALRLKSRLIGCNNRDLADFSVDPARAERLRALAPADCTFVGESGYATRADLDRAVAHGVRAFLIGEALMREDDIAVATRALVA